MIKGLIFRSQGDNLLKNEVTIQAGIRNQDKKRPVIKKSWDVLMYSRFLFLILQQDERH